MSAPIEFVKMSGAGNDFVVIDRGTADRLGGPGVEWVRRVCSRRLSVGADGVLVVERKGEGRARVLFVNPDGSATFCGNGSRCAARYAVMQGLVPARHVLETAAGRLPATVAGERVSLELPVPRNLGVVTVDGPSGARSGSFIVAGVPHWVVWAESVDEFPLEHWGPRARRDPLFGEEGTNVNVAAFRSDGTVELRTWERGVEGETLACGSGAVAVALAARLRGAGELVRLLPASGIPLDVRIEGDPTRPTGAVMSGDARVVFEGRLQAEALEGFPVPRRR